jgi:hypothetical protein
MSPCYSRRDAKVPPEPCRSAPEAAGTRTQRVASAQRRTVWLLSRTASVTLEQRWSIGSRHASRDKVAGGSEALYRERVDRCVAKSSTTIAGSLVVVSSHANVVPWYAVDVTVRHLAYAALESC